MRFFDVEPLPGYHSEIGILLASLQDSTREWRDELGEPSIEAITWQPGPQSHSIGGLLLHIIDVEDFWFRDFSACLERSEEDLVKFMSRETKQDEGIWPTPRAQPIGWYYDLHDSVRARAFEAIKGIEPTRRYERRSATSPPPSDG